ncbi:MAG: SpoIID/LytB domain-containing protein [Cyanobacteria bacterium RI_101]|nr:SpoIID/LytB domain-containing protein [Cyanobacteria bacterium RI_101]
MSYSLSFWRQFLCGARRFSLSAALILGGLTLWSGAAQALDLRVAITKGAGAVRVGSSTPGVVRDGAGKVVGSLDPLVPATATARGRGVSLGNWSASQLTVEPQGDGAVWIGDRWYRGRVRLLRQGAGVTAVNQVNIESYLYSVVGSEAIPSWPLEALKAQAVAARTYAIYQSSKDSNRYYDLDTTTATQVYKGLNAEYVSTVEAVEQTQGQVMTYGGKVILAAFHAASGGHTENVEDVWTSPLPYLRGVVDYDQNAPVFQWDKSFTSADLGRIFGVGAVQALTPLRTTARGRVVSLQVQGSRGRKTFTGAKVRQLLELRSALFTVSAEGGRFQILGRGSGHGIGLSQWGAYSLAQQGIPYAQILSHYYQNAALTQLER